MRGGMLCLQGMQCIYFPWGCGYDCSHSITGVHYFTLYDVVAPDINSMGIGRMTAMSSTHSSWTPSLRFWAVGDISWSKFIITSFFPNKVCLNYEMSNTFDKLCDAQLDYLFWHIYIIIIIIIIILLSSFYIITIIIITTTTVVIVTCIIPYPVDYLFWHIYIIVIIILSSLLLLVYYYYYYCCCYCCVLFLITCFDVDDWPRTMWNLLGGK